MIYHIKNPALRRIALVLSLPVIVPLIVALSLGAAFYRACCDMAWDIRECWRGE